MTAIDGFVPRTDFDDTAQYTDLVDAAPVIFEGTRSNDFTAMNYNGNFDHIVSTIDNDVVDGDARSLMFATARLVRAVVDAKIDTTATIRPADIQAVSEFALAIFRGQAQPDTLDALFKANPACRLSGDTVVKQEEDATTEESTKPRFIADAIDELQAKVGEADVLFMPLCHGGLLAGAWTYLGRQRQLPNTNSMLYPVRLSRDKHEDRFLRLNPAERTMLAQAAVGRQVVIFDEDAFSGQTVGIARQNLEMFIKSDVTVIVANDHRKET